MSDPHLKDIDELRTFVQVVESGGLTAAGRVLGLPTNVVSRRLARLEKRLGVPLAIRTTRRLEPTEEGRRLERRARRILAEVDAVHAEIRGVDLELSGELRLGIPTLLTEWARPALRRFVREHPQIALQLFVTDAPPSMVVGEIAAQGLDAAVLVGVVPPGPLVARRVGAVSLGLAASRAYIAERGLPRRLADLSDHDCLAFIGEGVQSTWTLVDRRGRERAVPVKGSFAATDSRTLRDAMIDGLGIGVVSPHELEARDELVPVLPRYRMAPLDLQLGYAASRRGSRRIAALHALLLEGARL